MIVSRDKPFSEICKNLFLWYSGVGYLWGSAYLTGWLLFIILFLIVFGSIPWIRYRHFKVQLPYVHIMYCTDHEKYTKDKITDDFLDSSVEGIPKKKMLFDVNQPNWKLVKVRT